MVTLEGQTPLALDLLLIFGHPGFSMIKVPWMPFFGDLTPQTPGSPFRPRTPDGFFYPSNQEDPLKTPGWHTFSTWNSPLIKNCREQFFFKRIIHQ